MIRADDLTIGCDVLVNNVLVKVAAITKKKIGYHLKPCENRMRYARLCEVFPVPLSSALAEQFNDHLRQIGLIGIVYLYWDSECGDCSHQYCLCYKGNMHTVRYLHELQIVANIFNIY